MKPAGQRLELLDEDALGLSLVIDVDVVPFAFADLGEVLDEGGLPVEADAHQTQVNLTLVGPLGQGAAFLFAGRFAVGQHDDLRQFAGAREFLHFIES